MLDHPLINQLRALDLPPEHFAVFGSGPLFAHHLTELSSDLDVIARGTAWEAARAIGEPVPAKSGVGQVINLAGGLLEIFDSWGPGNWDIDQLIDQAEVIDGMRFVRLEDVLKWKKMMNRPKDAQHIKLIEEFLNRK